MVFGEGLRRICGLTALAPVLGANSALADDGHDGRRVHDHDDDWRGGHGVHGDHNGRGGWWWVIGSGRYFFPAPVPPDVTAHAPPPVTAAPSSTYWYYCQNPSGYYPDIPDCPTPRVVVPALAN